MTLIGFSVVYENPFLLWFCTATVTSSARVNHHNTSELHLVRFPFVRPSKDVTIDTSAENLRIQYVRQWIKRIKDAAFRFWNETTEFELSTLQKEQRASGPKRLAGSLIPCRIVNTNHVILKGSGGRGNSFRATIPSRSSRRSIMTKRISPEITLRVHATRIV